MVIEMGSCGISIRRNAGKPDAPNVVSSGDRLPCNWFRSAESVRNMFITRNCAYKKLYTVLSCLSVFTFCTCKTLICVVCFVASLKLSFV